MLADQAEKLLGPLKDESPSGLAAVAHTVTSDLDYTIYQSVLSELTVRWDAARQYVKPSPNGQVIIEPSGGTLAELLAKQIDPIHYVVHNLIPEGLTLLAGKPKLGKSWLALALSLGVCSGNETLGHWTEAGEVLYIALEDGERRMQDRVKILEGYLLGPTALSRFHYRTEWASLDRDGLTQLEAWMTDHPDTRLIVVDTYGKLRGDLPGKDRFIEEYGLLGKLQTFATKHRLAVVLVHHLRKQGADDWLEQLSGSQAISAAADTLLGLFRERGLMDATLRLVSREMDEIDWALKFDGGRWESMGEAAQYRITVERGAILEALEELGGTGKVSEIAELTERTSANTSKLLAALEREKLVRKVSYGVFALKDTSKVVELPSTSTTTTTTYDQGSPLQPNQLLQLGVCADCGFTGNRHSNICSQSDRW